MPEVVVKWDSIAVEALYTKLNTSKEGNIFQNIFLPGTWVTAVRMLYINSNLFSVTRDKELKSDTSPQEHLASLLSEMTASD